MKRDLDLSLPIRLISLPQGCKLKMIRTKNERCGELLVTVRLQIISPEGETLNNYPVESLVQKFDSSTSLIDVIKKYEQVLNDSLLNRKSHYDDVKLGKRVYCEYHSMIQTISKVIDTIEEMKSTDLRRLGMTKGNHSLRLKFIREDIRAEDIKEEDKVIEVPEIKPEIHEPIEAKSSIPVMEKEIESSGEKPAVNVAVFSKQTKQISHEDTDDSVYDMTVEQARKYQALLSRRATGGPMMTRALREKLKSERNVEVLECLIRIRFPDHTTVQIELKATQSLRDLYDVLISTILDLSSEEISLLASDDPIFFDLMTLYPQTKLLSTEEDLDKQLVANCHLGKRSLLVYREKQPSGKIHFVKEEYLQNAKPLNDMDELKLEEQMEAKPKESANEIARNLRPHTTTKKVPKWFKMGRI
ncbi:hypothetical protein FOA43_002180 [Brettanomyces nanus]|uniref:UBX domain-containing protein n=1 Tax=Eeniella nana TaxID=13502 RepID=A0A875S6N5_EENNA|nr:uncharacterized protein FOA43_002180 [Brettanomyces nanus]QPG74844.1 hypothetical protein FOA43_002180 [Brettanomyces nanus]